MPEQFGFDLRSIDQVPVVRSVYKASRDIVETATLSKRQVFREVVMIEYPRPGLYSYGFVTGYTSREEQRLAHVFIPGPPVPTTGHLIVAPVEELVFDGPFMVQSYTPDERAVLAILDEVEPVHVDELAEKGPLGVARLQAALFGLESEHDAERVMAALNGWLGAEQSPPARLLEGADLDHVAQQRPLGDQLVAVTQDHQIRALGGHPAGVAQLPVER